MVKEIAISMVLAASLFRPVLSSEVFSGNELKATCNAPDNSYSAGICFGFVYGFAAGVNGGFYSSYIETYYCPPPGISAGQLRDVTVKYLNDHPEELHEYAATIVSNALSEAFPCKK